MARAKKADIEAQMNLMPTTTEDFLVIQPNAVTFGNYSISDWQEDLLTLVQEALRKHMTREQDLLKDRFNQPYITVMCDEVGGVRNKAKLIAEWDDMKNKGFKFSWKHPVTGLEVSTSGIIFPTIHDIKGTNKVNININPWAIPVLLYYGKGTGGTFFSRATALALKGSYTKRLYKIICSQRDRPVYRYKIDRFKRDMQLSESVSNSYIKQKILQPSKERIDASNSDVKFDFELFESDEAKAIARREKRKTSADMICFYIKVDNPIKAGGEQSHEFSFVYRWVSNALNFQTNDTAVRAMDKIVESGELNKVYSRCCYYDDLVCEGNMVKAKAENSLLKMLREDFGVDTTKRK